ncbi:MAG: NAD(P)H-dependent oxidoreductase [Albidovulum sp.]|jgi:FMN-dependent NADH-azoreductase
MTKVLRIDSSIKGAASVTRKLTDTLVARLDDPEVTLRDAQDIALIDGAWVGAAYTPRENRTAEQNATLALSDALIAELRAADAIVIGMPVYNFGVTGPLKAWLDQICRVNETFSYSEGGPKGLLADKPVYVVYASGGVPMGSDYDFASGYLRQVLGFVGLTNVQFVAAEGVAADEAAALTRAEDAIAALAA